MILLLIAIAVLHIRGVLLLACLGRGASWYAMLSGAAAFWLMIATVLVRAFGGRIFPHAAARFGMAYPLFLGISGAALIVFGAGFVRIRRDIAALRRRAMELQASAFVRGVSFPPIDLSKPQACMNAGGIFLAVDLLLAFSPALRVLDGSFAGALLVISGFYATLAAGSGLFFGGFFAYALRVARTHRRVQDLEMSRNSLPAAGAASSSTDP